MINIFEILRYLVPAELPCGLLFEFPLDRGGEDEGFLPGSLNGLRARVGGEMMLKHSHPQVRVCRDLKTSKNTSESYSQKRAERLQGLI